LKNREIAESNCFNGIERKNGVRVHFEKMKCTLTPLIFAGYARVYPTIKAI
jgi:hypothetical protein